MAIRAPQPRESIVSEQPDIVLDVRDADLLPEQRVAIENIHGQITAIAQRYGVTTLEELAEKLLAADQRERVAASRDVAVLTRLAERMRTLLEGTTTIKEALETRKESEALAREATDGIAFDDVTILRAASESPPAQLQILSPVLETYLTNGERADVERELARIGVGFTEKEDVHRLPGFTADPFRALGRFGKREYAENLLAGLHMRFRADYWASYAAGLAEAGRDGESDTAFNEVEQRIPRDAEDRVYAYVALARALYSVGRSPQYAIENAERALGPVTTGGQMRVWAVQQKVNALLDVCIATGSSAVARRVAGGDETEGILADCRRADFSALVLLYTYNKNVQRRIAEDALPYVIDARAWAHVDTLLHCGSRPEYIAGEVAKKVSLPEYEQFLQANIDLQRNDMARFHHAELLAREGRREDAAKIIDELDGTGGYLTYPAYPALLYRLGREDAAKDHAEQQQTTLAHILLAQAMLPDNEKAQEALAWVGSLMPGAPGRPYTSPSEGVPGEIAVAKHSVVLELISCNFVDEARKHARGIDATVGSGKLFADAWAKIGEWYANNALQKAKEAYTVLKKLEE